jgi:beta-1,4-mannosyl-glycoprotein beta-1,4-N-acetylglucosaminyltransferase
VTVWSVTPFCGELDILELRLRTLDEVVDRHVIVEAFETQTGRPKPLVFWENKARFAPWQDKIVHVVQPTLSMRGAWARERSQRDACMVGMDDLAPGDLVFLSDVDEIPDPACFAVADPSAGPVWVGMSMHLYYLNWRWPELPVAGGTRASFVTGAQLLERPASRLVEEQASHMPGVNGWHLSYQGGVEAIQAKLRACADFEDGGTLLLAGEWQSRWASAAHIEACMATGADLFDRAHRQCEWVGLDALPPAASEDRFAHMVIPEPMLVAA